MNKVKISVRAAEGRIRRKLKADGQQLVKIKEGSRWFDQYGPYQVVNDRNVVEAHGCTLEQLAKDSGVLKPYEEIADE
jgi:hypothetical protein